MNELSRAMDLLSRAVVMDLLSSAVALQQRVLCNHTAKQKGCEIADTDKGLGHQKELA